MSISINKFHRLALVMNPGGGGGGRGEKGVQFLFALFFW